MLPEDGQRSSTAIWKNFLQETSLHGCQKVSDPKRNKFVRTIWFFVIIIAITCWLFTSFFLLLEIKDNKVTTVFQSHYAKSLEFPSLTICSTCPVDMSKVNISEELLDMVMSTSEWEILKSPPGNDTDFAEEGKQIGEILAKARLDMDSIFLQLRWDRAVINASAVLEKVHSTEGNCYLFNGGDQKERFFADYGGYATGLEVIANTHQTWCPGGAFDKGGLKIYIHSSLDKVVSNNTSPSPDIMLSPGTSTNIGLSLTKTRFLQQPFTSIGNLYCNPTVNYSRTNCINDCVLEKVEAICVCDDDPSCKVKNMGCQREFSREYRIQAEKNEICDCSYPCVLTEYVTDLSFSYFPTDAVSEKLVSLGEIPDVTYARKNLLRFTMNFKQMVEREIIYEPVYSLESILGTVGGHLGLFLGASVITATELLEACISFLVDKCCSCFISSPSLTKVKPFKP